MWSGLPQESIPAARYPKKCCPGMHFPDLSVRLPSPQEAYSVTHYRLTTRNQDEVPSMDKQDNVQEVTP